ncbi:MAG: DNA-binding transcriptional regulator BaeR [Segetibacter sp.]|nr:DNA-binding transcriptional regulator BaeR [Segetibacter sp.]
MANHLSKDQLLKLAENISMPVVVSAEVHEKEKLEKRLKQHCDRLKQIAWIQSHKVRAPLTNILSIIKLLDFERGNLETNQVLLEHLKTSAHNLDSIIKEITSLTISDNGSLSGYR